MRLHSAFFLCLCFLLVFSLSAECKKKRNKKTKKTKGKWTCDKKTKPMTFMTTAKNLGKGLKVGCKHGQISRLSLVGYNGTCQGLTPHLFVQMNSCYWKKDCSFTYDEEALTNYMLKLYNGTTDCVVKSPDTFELTYDCSHKKAKVSDLPTVEGHTIKEKAGILRSHPDHPWLYKRSELPETLTLARPGSKKAFKFFTFTIRTLSLESGDRLSIEGFDDKNGSLGSPINVTHEITLDDDVKSRTYGIGKSPNTVRVSLDASDHTNGGEGFVLCFKWSKKLKKGKDVCKKMILPQKCKPKVG